MAECMDCGKAIGNEQIRCAACREEHAVGGNRIMTKCKHCSRPIWAPKALCGPCAWAGRMILRKRKRAHA